MFDMVKIFSATKARDRDALGEKVTEWLGRQRNMEVADTKVLQSSDAEFHCISIVLFLRKK